jgi:D-alanyl-D-alanine carboxypeptidase
MHIRSARLAAALLVGALLTAVMPAGAMAKAHPQPKHRHGHAVHALVHHGHGHARHVKGRHRLALHAPGAAYVAPVHGAILMEERSGKVLAEVNADRVTYPASLTKMMTLMLTFEALDRGDLKLGEAIPVSRHAASVKPSRLGLAAGSTISVADAILAITVKSANDAATALGEALGGDEPHFARLMTRRAHELGMDATTFRNASGLPDPEQRTTARDIAVLARALIEKEPQHYRYFSVARFDFAGATIHGHNHLLGRYAGLDGLKTGFINASGFNLAASAMRNGRRLIAVVLGGTSIRARDNEIAELLDTGFATPAPVITQAAARTSVHTAASAEN